MDNLSYNALKLETAGKKQEHKVLNSISDCGIASLCYAYKFRVKSEAKLIEKVHRKSKENPKYNLEKITDVIGLRLITLFKNEIPQILEETLLLIRHQKDLKPNPFQENLPEEVIIYTNAPHYDPFLTELQSVLVNQNITFETRESKEGYSSVHIVTRLTSAAQLTSDQNTPVEHQIPVEIQIRSVFEDAWGEIDHRFGYVMRAGKGEANVVYNSSIVQPHLKVLKQFTDACAQYADTIYTSAHAPVSVKESSGKIVSVPSDDEVLHRFSTINVPENFRQKYIEGRTLRESAISTLAINRVNGQAKCLEAAAYFLSLGQKSAAELDENSGIMLYSFYVKMNEALCLLSSDSPLHVKSAENIYLQLKDSYPEFVLVKFRLGQTYAKLGNIDGSLALFEETKMAVINFFQPAGSKEWPDELPKIDYLHICRLLPKLIGYQYWKKASLSEKTSEKLDLFLKAHDATKERIGVADPDLHIPNNLVYYAFEYLKISEVTSASTKRLATSLHTNLAHMEHSLKNDESKFDMSTLDTMMEAYHFLGRINLAQNIAGRILESVKSADPSKYSDPEEMLSIIKSALFVQSLQEASVPANTLDKQL